MDRTVPVRGRSGARDQPDRPRWGIGIRAECSRVIRVAEYGRSADRVNSTRCPGRCQPTELRSMTSCSPPWPISRARVRPMPWQYQA